MAWEVDLDPLRGNHTPGMGLAQADDIAVSTVPVLITKVRKSIFSISRSRTMGIAKVPSRREAGLSYG